MRSVIITGMITASRSMLLLWIEFNRIRGKEYTRVRGEISRAHRSRVHRFTGRSSLGSQVRSKFLTSLEMSQRDLFPMESERFIY